MCQNPVCPQKHIWFEMTKSYARSREWNQKGIKLVSGYERTYKLFEKARTVYKPQLNCNVEIPVQH